MSIIHDALKKTQNNLQETQTVTSPTAPKLKNQNTSDTKENTPSSKPTPLKKHNTQSIFIIIAIAIFCFISGLAITLLIKKFDRPELEKLTQTFTSSQTTLSEKPEPLSSNELTQKSAPIVTKEITPKKIAIPNNRTLILGGIMLADETYVALINDEIYAVGEFVEGIEVIEVMAVTLKEVQLRTDSGKTITLNIKRGKNTYTP